MKRKYLPESELLLFISLLLLMVSFSGIAAYNIIKSPSYGKKNSKNDNKFEFFNQINASLYQLKNIKGPKLFNQCNQEHFS